MKLPRWLVIAMLTTSMLSVLAAAGWWWVTWPERTARNMMKRFDDGEFLETNDMLVDCQWKQVMNGPNDIGMKTKRGTFEFARSRWEACSRSWSDNGVILTRDVGGTTKEEFAILLRRRELADVFFGRQVLRLKTPYRSSDGRIAVDFTIEKGKARGEMLINSD